MDNLTETLIQSTFMYRGNVVSISHDTVRLPNGKNATRDVVNHPGAVCVLAITDQVQAVLVRQYRHPCRQILLEIPAGKLDVSGEPPEQCAYRELAEETPYTAQSMRLMNLFYTAPGFCDERMYLYRAEGLVRNSTACADEDEFVQTVLLSKEEVRQAIASDQIHDAKTLIALLQWLLES